MYLSICLLEFASFTILNIDILDGVKTGQWCGEEAVPSTVGVTTIVDSWEELMGPG